MAHILKYYKDIESQSNNWRIEILQDTDESIQAEEIGPVVQGLRLIVQGDQADIDTPIVKTSLEMVFADAPDLEAERKCGYWEEFYTSSATEYLVQLYKNHTLEWSGYITPDSFSESLQYRGSVTIIARDNLGLLQDFEYSEVANYYGMQNIETLLAKALRKISFPMEILIPDIEQGARRIAFTQVKPFSQEAWRIQFNNNAVEDKTYQETLESLFYSAGLVFRYVGKNTFVLASIRDLPLYDKDYYWDVPVKDVLFCAYGHRELSPAAHSIVEEVHFDIEDNIADSYISANAYGESGQYLFKAETDSGAQYFPIYNIAEGIWSAPSIDKSLFFNPFAYPLKEGYSSQKNGDLRSENVIYLAGNAAYASGDPDDYFGWQNRSAIYRALLGEGEYKFSFKADSPIALFDDRTKIGFADAETERSSLRLKLSFKSNDGSQNLVYRASHEDWIEDDGKENIGNFTGLEFPHIFDNFPTLKVESKGYLELEIVNIVIRFKTERISEGAYLRINDIIINDITAVNSTLPQSLKVTTNYNAKNNIRIQRTANFGFNMGEYSSPKTIRNGLYVFSNSWYDASDEWVFNSSDTPQPLPVLIHQQLLAYYSKPNNVLTGELATRNPLFNALYKWKGKNHLLMSGSLNVLTGRMENAVLREFTRYDHMWETWVETDDVEVDYAATSIQLRVHSNKTITSADLSGLPLWLIGSVQSAGNGVYIVSLAVEANSSSERTSIINIDTALVRITQLAPGDYGLDYGLDYGEDYS